MSAKTKVSALDHAMHIAHTWVNDVARELDTEDREFAYRVLRAWLHTLRDRLPVEASAHFAAQRGLESQRRPRKIRCPRIHSPVSP